MRKKLLLFLSFMLSLWSYGQFTFPTVTGPISVSGGTAENVLINDAANAAAVPAGLYDSFSVSVDWVSTNNAWASEADLTINTSGGSVTIDPPTTGSANSGAPTTLTFSGSLTSLYDPSVDGLLTLDLNQSSWVANDADWSNIVVTLFEAPTCPDPLDLGISNLTATTVDLGWTEFGTATTWNVEYGAAGFSQGSGTVVNTTSNPHNLTGLTPETVYEFYVQSDCGGTDQSNWVGPYTFTTSCLATNVPYLQDFESATAPNIPTCTSIENTGIGNDWKTKSTTTTGFTGKVLNYSYHPSTSAGAANSWFYTQGINLVAGVSYTISYKYGNNSTFYTESMKVAYGTAANELGMTNALADYPAIQFSTPADESLVFTVAADDVYYFGFNVYSIENQNQLYLDDIEIYETPTCFPPSDLIGSNITASSVDLAWTIGDSETDWNISWGTPGYTPGDANEIGVSSASTTPAHQIIGLTDNTQYDVYIQADCGGGDQSAWSGPLSISTECTATNVPYVQDFESVTTPGMPSCTSIENVGSGNDWETASVTNYGFNSTVLRYSWNSDNDADAWFYTQGINLTAGTAYKISYEYGSTTFEEKLKVAYGTSPSSIGMTTTLADHTIASGTLNPNTVLFTPGVTDVYYFGFNAHSDADKFYLHVDNIVVELVPPCLDPTDFVASNMTGSSVDLSWTANGTATEWNIEYGANGFTQGTGTTETGVTANPYTLTGLTQGTDYDVYIQSDCGVNQGTWVGPLSFSTTTCTPTTGDTTAVACDSFEWFGTTYTASGTATHVLTNAAGCDSTVTLTLTINTSVTGTDTQTACGSFTWIDGVEYTASNNTAMYTIVGGAANGCDSIVTLDLTINPVATGTDTQTACGSFTWIDGVEYTASNNTAMYTIVGGAANGCDSIVTLDLTINQVATGTDVQASCGPFTWIDGVEYTATNNTAMHTIVGGAANGCDSIVTLNLTVDTEVSAGNDNAITVCKGEQIDLDTLLSADADAGGTWYNSMNTPLASSVILSSFTAGNYDYTYEVVGSGACPDQTAVITVTVDGGCTADVNEEILGNISVYPNPTTSVLNIVNPSNTSSLRIEMLDMNGRVVMVENSALNNATEATLTIDHLEKGIYTLRVYNNEGHKTFKIVKQ